MLTGRTSSGERRRSAVAESPLVETAAADELDVSAAFLQLRLGVGNVVLWPMSHAVKPARRGLVRVHWSGSQIGNSTSGSIRPIGITYPAKPIRVDRGIHNGDI